ncbi:hypothetical protein [Leptospira interrogans]|uniref:hypothetical protein n=1 Tax=Leptospira interrogans TaxID=173 RepID=UPI0009AF1E1C|nr:hypothetical protein [Leptospira interrogans]
MYKKITRETFTDNLSIFPYTDKLMKVFIGLIEDSNCSVFNPFNRRIRNFLLSDNKHETLTKITKVINNVSSVMIHFSKKVRI